MNLFKDYEQEFIKTISVINKDIENIRTQNNRTCFFNVDRKELAFADIKSDLTECEKYVKMMETQIAGMNPNQKH